MTAPAGIVPVSDDRLLATCLRIRPALHDMPGASAQLALSAVEDVITVLLACDTAYRADREPREARAAARNKS